MSPRTPSADFTAGIRAAVTWLHAEAQRMNDPKARQILNDAAFHLGQDKPVYSASIPPTEDAGRIGVTDRLRAALSDNPPDFASVHVLAGDLRKVLEL